MRRYLINTPFLHQLSDAQALFEVVAKERKILPVLVEKDYWIMHCLWGISRSGFEFDLKGGTSLSKGFNIIKRFSEDIDIQIYPKPEDDIKIGKNHDKPAHIESRRQFFEKITKQLCIPGLIFSRDFNFDDSIKMRGAGINPALTLMDPAIRALYAKEFKKKSSLYFEEQIEFETILGRIGQYVHQM